MTAFSASCATVPTVVNDYLTAIELFRCRCADGGWLFSGKRRTKPVFGCPMCHREVMPRWARHDFVADYAWAIPDDDASKRITGITHARTTRSRKPTRRLRPTFPITRWCSAGRPTT